MIQNDPGEKIVVHHEVKPLVEPTNPVVYRPSPKGRLLQVTGVAGKGPRPGALIDDPPVTLEMDVIGAEKNIAMREITGQVRRLPQ